MADSRTDQRKHQRKVISRLSPSELAGLIPAQYWGRNMDAGVLAGSYRNHLKQVKRIEKLTRGMGAVIPPRRVRPPNLAKLDALDRKLREFPTHRRFLTVKEFSLYLESLHQMRRTIAGLVKKVRRHEHRMAQERYLARIGRIFLDAPDDVLEEFILARANRAGSNVHAAALARIRNADLPPEKLAQWGRKGAEARWGKRRSATVADESISSPGESSQNADQASSAPV